MPRHRPIAFGLSINCSVPTVNASVCYQSPHAGKSTVARQLAIAISHGKSFLGRETMKSKVAYWQSEETTEDAAEDFAKSGMTQDDPIVILQPSPPTTISKNSTKC